jgi:hypothetical protein
VTGELLEGEADDAEEESEEKEASELDGFAADGVHEGDGDPVTGDGAGADEDEVANGVFVEDVVNVARNKGVRVGVGLRRGCEGWNLRSTSPTYCGQDDGIIETESVEGDIQHEP